MGNKEYKATVVYENGGHTSFPVGNINSKKELLEYLIEKDVYIEEIVSITITVFEY